MIAVVPAAGRGSRLGGLTDRRPKPLVDVGGRPVLRWILEGLAPYADGVVVVTGWLGGAIVDAVPTWGLSIPVRFVDQPEPLGTAHALSLARDTIGETPFLFAWGDVLMPEGVVGEVVSAGRSDEAVIAVDHVGDVRDGAAVRLEGDRVVSIVEKPPGPSRSGWNSAGCGRLPADAWTLIDRAPESDRGERELTSVLASYADRGRLVAVTVDGPVFDIGTPDRLAQAEAWFSGGGRPSGR